MRYWNPSRSDKGGEKSVPFFRYRYRYRCIQCWIRLTPSLSNHKKNPPRGIIQSDVRGLNPPICHQFLSLVFVVNPDRVMRSGTL